MLFLGGILFSIIFGILLHYVFEWSGRSLLVAFLAPTNESYFEHMKLLATPYLLWTLVEYAHYGQFMHAFIPAKVIGLYAGMLLILVLHLLYIRIVPSPAVWGKVLIFCISVVAAFVLAEFLMTLTILDYAGLELIFDGVLVLTGFLFAVFTIYPPSHWFFKPPVG